MLNAPPYLEVLSGAPHNALRTSASTFLTSRVAWAHHELPLNTSKVDYSIWVVWMSLSDCFTSCWCGIFAIHHSPAYCKYSFLSLNKRPAVITLTFVYSFPTTLSLLCVFLYLCYLGCYSPVLPVIFASRLSYSTDMNLSSICC